MNVPIKLAAAESCFPLRGLGGFLSVNILPLFCQSSLKTRYLHSKINEYTYEKAASDKCYSGKRICRIRR